MFTTHTPVPAGIDRFGRDQIETFFGGDNAVAGVPVEKILALGAETFPGGDPSVFNMAVMGLRLAQRANGVSRLHGAVSREMFHGLWPGFEMSEVPITSITNGVHAPTWVDQRVVELGEKYIGSRITVDARDWEEVERIPDQEIWAARRAMRAGLVADARRRVRSSWLKRGASPAELGWVDSVLDPDVLTIGFARRVPTYKRLTLMLRDPERLRALLLHPTRPVQIVIAGKSHPADDNGKRLIQQMVKFADDPEVRHRIVFLPNYDIAMAQSLYPGCDVWLNNPLRPLRGLRHLGHEGGAQRRPQPLHPRRLVGRVVRRRERLGDPDGRRRRRPRAPRRPRGRGAVRPDRDQVAPRFYDRDERGLPMRWLEMVEHTLSSLGPEGAGHPDGARLRNKLYVPARGGRADGRVPCRARAWRRSRRGCARRGRACGSTTSSRRASATPRRSATRSACAPSSPSATARPQGRRRPGRLRPGRRRRTR